MIDITTLPYEADILRQIYNFERSHDEKRTKEAYKGAHYV
jgi:hypothetical protein